MKERQLPALPKSGGRIAAQDVLAIEQQVADNIEFVEDVETAQEWRAQARALEAYLRSKNLQAPLLGAQRRIEARIGQLLGEPVSGRPRNVGHDRHFVEAKDDRVDFRILARALDDIHLEDEEWRKSRRSLVALVRERAGLVPESPPLPRGIYDVLLADPPWQYDFAETDNRQIENHYPTMTADAIGALDVPAAENSVLFMWATAPKLREAFRVLDAWRFEYVTNAVWVKSQMGMGYWFRGRHELLLVGRRGSFSPPPPDARAPSVFEASRGRHSEKPESVHVAIERMFPNASRLELFAREKRDGWETWGNDEAVAA